MPTAAATRVAAIDCGTNSLRLLIADLPKPGRPLVEVARRMEIVRLGQGVDRTGRLAAEAIERARAVLRRYADEIWNSGAGRVRMVATSACRDAANVEDFTVMVRRTLGITPEVITGDEEAGLSFTGAIRGLPAGLATPYLVVDIGGGSTEFVAGTAVAGSIEVAAAASVDIGCVRITERHLSGDPPTPDQVAAARADIDAAVEQALATVAEAVPVPAGTLVGLAGSVTTVAAIALGLETYRPESIHHGVVTAAQVARISADLLAMNRAQRLALPVMHPGRAEVIGAGALILHAVVAACGAPAVVASEHDILDGIAYALAG